MRTLTLVLATSFLLLAAGPLVAPPAAATTCAVGWEKLERPVCGAILSALCVLENGGTRPDAKGAVACVLP